MAGEKEKWPVITGNRPLFASLLTFLFSVASLNDDLVHSFRGIQFKQNLLAIAGVVDLSSRLQTPQIYSHFEQYKTLAIIYYSTQFNISLI